MKHQLDNVFDHGRSESGFWPNDSQARLIRLVLDLDADRESAYKAWRNTVDFNEFGQGSLRLVPMLQHFLEEPFIPEPDQNFIRNARRLTWWQTSVRLKTLASINNTLTAGNIEFMPIKGMALLIDGTYASAADRPTADIDVYVKPADLRASLQLLLADGWKSVGDDLLHDIDSLISSRHAVELRRGDDENLDLHWSLLHRFGTVCNNHEEYWIGCRHIDYAGARYTVLNPTHQLLQCCAHGTRWAFWVSPIRWLVDAYRIIAVHGTQIDWVELVADAVRLDVVPPVKETLLYLANELNADIPPSAISAISQCKASYTARLEAYICSRPYVWNCYPQRMIGIWRFSREEHRTLAKKIINAPVYARTIMLVPQTHTISEELLAKLKRFGKRLKFSGNT